MSGSRARCARRRGLPDRLPPKPRLAYLLRASGCAPAGLPLAARGDLALQACRSGPVAQGIEQQPSKLKVAGSNPAGVANYLNDLSQVCERARSRNRDGVTLGVTADKIKLGSLESRNGVRATPRFQPPDGTRQFQSRSGHGYAAAPRTLLRRHRETVTTWKTRPGRSWVPSGQRSDLRGGFHSRRRQPPAEVCSRASAAESAPAGSGYRRRLCGQLNDGIRGFKAVVHGYPDYRVLFLDHHSSRFGSFSRRV